MSLKAPTADQLLGTIFTQLTLGDDPTKSTTRAVTRSYPDSITSWGNFDPDQFTAQLSAGSKFSFVTLPQRPAELTVRNESGMENRFISTIALTLNQFSEQIGLIQKRADAYCSTDSTTMCDEICFHGNRVFAVQEMKLFNNLSDMPDAAEDIATRYGDGVDPNGVDPNGGVHYLRDEHVVQSGGTDLWIYA